MLRKNLLILLTIALFGVFSVIAQDDDPVVVPEDTEGAIVQTAASGTIEENDDGTYTLTLSGVDEFVPMVFYAPSFFTSNYRAQLLADDWSYYNANADEPMMANAILQIGIDLNSRIFVNAQVMPVADLAFTPAAGEEPATFSYIISFDDEADVSTDDPENDKPEVPSSFDGATLTIQTDADLLTTLAEASVERSDADRYTGAYCNPYISSCGR